MNRLLSLAGCALMLYSGAAYGQEKQQKPQSRENQESRENGNQEKKMRRLESVTWDPIQHKLHWVVSKGTVSGGEYKASEKHEYDINMDQATMSFSAETRRFSEQEAESVGALLDLIAQYAAESTVWWEQGHGEPLNKKGMPVSLPSSTARNYSVKPVSAVLP